MRVALLVSVAMLMLWGGRADAFDQERKGFVLGLGAGLAPYASIRLKPESSNYLDPDDSSYGFSYQLFAGYGWNERNWFLFELNLVYRDSEAYDLSITQGMRAISWYHAYGPRGSAWITAVGVGQQVAVEESHISISFGGPPSPAGPPEDPGLGFLLGVGYEFHPRVSSMMYGTTGTTYEHGLEFRQSNLSLLLQYLWD